MLNPRLILKLTMKIYAMYMYYILIYWIFYI